MDIFITLYSPHAFISILIHAFFSRKHLDQFFGYPVPSWLPRTRLYFYTCNGMFNPALPEAYLFALIPKGREQITIGE